MKHARPFLSLLLSGVMLLTLFPSASFAAQATEGTPIPTVSIQFLTQTKFPRTPSQSSSVRFSSDSWGICDSPETGGCGVVDPYGSVLLPARVNNSVGSALGDKLFSFTTGGNYALFHSSGAQRTDYCYQTLELDGDYIRGIRPDGTRDFFTLDGTKISLPKLPEGSLVWSMLGHGVMAVGVKGSSTPQLQLYTTNGVLLSRSGVRFQSIVRVNDNLICTRDTAGQYQVLDNQGKVVIDRAQDVFPAEAPDGSFVCAHSGYYAAYSPTGHQLFAVPDCTRMTVFSQHALVFCRLGDPGSTWHLWTSQLGEVTGGQQDCSIGSQYSPSRCDTPYFHLRLADGTTSVFDYNGNAVMSGISGSVLVQDHCVMVMDADSTAYYDLSGTPLFTLRSPNTTPVCGFVVDRPDRSRCIIYNRNGEAISRFSYSAFADSGVDGLLSVQREGKWYLINAVGQELNPVGFDNAVTFSKGCHLTGYSIGSLCGILRYLDAENPHPFLDVPAGRWYTEAVEFCYANGLMSGTAVAKFEPSTVTTRAMVVQILYNLAGEGEICPSHGFKDVPNGKWFTNAVNWAAKHGIVNGISADTFAPNSPITREQAASILMRFTQSLGLKTRSYPDPTKFSDWGKVSGWAKESMRWATGIGLLQGSGGKVNPLGKATRAEIATILRGYVLWLAEQEGTRPILP